MRSSNILAHGFWGAARSVNKTLLAVVFAVLSALLVMGPFAPFTFGTAGAQSAELQAAKDALTSIYNDYEGQLDAIEFPYDDADADLAKDIREDGEDALKAEHDARKDSFDGAEKDELKDHFESLKDQLKTIQEAIKDAASGGGDFCTDGTAYYVEYSDGTADYIGTGDRSAWEWCGGNDVFKADFELAAQQHGLNWTMRSNKLHVSCSDPGIWIPGEPITKSEIPAGVTVNADASWIEKSNGDFCGDKTPPADPNVGIEKSSDAPSGVSAGDSFTWELEVVSDGSADATNVVVTDEIPASLTVDGATPTWDSKSGNTYTWNLGDMATGTSQTITIDVTTSTADCPDVTNNASVSATNDSDSSDNSDSDTVDVTCPTLKPDVVVEKKANKTTVNEEGQWTYELIVTEQSGQANATGVEVEDVLPAGVNFVSASSNCAESAGTVTCDLDTVNAGESETVSITVQAKPGVCGIVENTGTVSADDESDTTNNTSNTVEVEVICIPDCDGPVNVLVRDADTGAIVAEPGAKATVEGGSNDLDADGNTDIGRFPCLEDIDGLLTQAPTDYTIVDANDRIEDLTSAGGTLVFTVRKVVVCTGPVNAIVRDADTNAIVAEPGAVARVEGVTHNLDADGDTDIDTFPCGEDIDGVLTQAPAGYDIVDANDRIEDLTSAGGTLVFTVRKQPPPCPAPVKVELHVGSVDGPLVGPGEANVEGNTVAIGNDGRGDAGNGFDCGDDVDGNLTAIPDGYTITRGTDRLENITSSGGTLKFVVSPIPGPCEGPVDIEIRDADTDRLVTTGGGIVQVNGRNHAVGTSGTADAGDFVCDDYVSGRLTQLPRDYDETVVGFDDIDRVTRAGGTLVFEVRREEVCEGPVDVEVRHADTGDLVREDGAEATIDGDSLDLDDDGRTDAGDWDCGDDVDGILDEAPDGYEIVDGFDRIDNVRRSGNTLVFTVREPDVPGPCVGPLTIEVIDVDTGDRVGPGEARVEGDTVDLDADGLTDGDEYECETNIDGQLTTPPDGYEIVDGDDSVVMDENGETLTFLVRQPAPEVECEGSLIVRIVDTEGNLVGGGEISVGPDGYVLPDGEVVFPSRDCGTLTVTLDEPPTGTFPVGPTAETVSIENDDTEVVEFIVDTIEVLPEPPIDREPPAPAPQPPAPAPQPPAVQPRLPRTGMDAGAALVLAVLSAGFGLVLLGLSRRREGREGG